ncbi:MAG: hypothetical protein LW832_02530, partial [Parachlamydia sp.]|nr:hypothetical protein [Parachlamydia sp.]
MAAISIAEKLIPFSHTPGTFALIPFTTYAVEAFPSLFRIYEWGGREPLLLTTMQLGIQGPLRDFTLLSDLEKGLIKVRLRSGTGFYEYELSGSHEKVLFNLKRSPTGSLSLNEKSAFLNCPLSMIEGRAVEHPKIFEKLSLGNHKKQDIDLILRRQDLKEILPLFYSFAQKVPLLIEKNDLNLESILLTPMEKGYEWWSDFFLSYFKAFLTPVWTDERFLGLRQSNRSLHFSPLFLINKAFNHLRLMFITAQDGCIK